MTRVDRRDRIGDGGIVNGGFVGGASVSSARREPYHALR
jgi:hypothetical protein